MVGNIIGGADIQVEYDFARQALRITQTGDDTIHLSSDAAVTGELFGATNLALTTVSDATERNTALASISALLFLLTVITRLF